MSFRLRVTLLAAAAVAIGGRRRRPPSSTSSSATSCSARSTRASSAAPGTSPSTPGRAPSSATCSSGRARSLGGPPTYLQVIDSTGQGRRSTLPGLDRAKKLAATGGKPFFTDGTRRGHARARVRGAGRRRACRPGRAVAGGGRPHAPPARPVHALHRARSASGSPAGSGSSSPARRCGRSDSLTSVAEEVTATRDLSRRIDGAQRRRARPARLGVQRDARRARHLREGAAPARRGRLARAADAARQPADEHRGARRREGAPRRRSERSCSPTSLGQVEELSAPRRRPRRDRPRTRRPEVEDVRLDELVEQRGRAREGAGAERAVPDAAPGVGRPRRAGPARAGGLEPARQRREVEQLGRRGGRRARGDRPRPRPWDLRGGPPPRLRPLLPGRERAQPARLRARPAIVRQVARHARRRGVTAENAPDGGAVFRAAPRLRRRGRTRPINVSGPCPTR